MKFASIRAAGEDLYGAVTDAGFIALSANFPHWANLNRSDLRAGLTAAGESG